MTGWSPAAATAAACPNAAYRTGPSAGLPDCRAYEMVSPADKGANTLLFTTTGASGFTYPSVSGDQAYFGSLTPFADPKSGRPGQFVAARTANGWGTHDITPADCAADPTGLSGGYAVSGFSRDFSTAIFADYSENCADPRDHAGLDVYRRDPDGSLHWISQNGSPKTDDVTATYVGASADASHVLFTTPQQLVPSVDSGRADGAVGLYDRTIGKTLPVAVDDDGAAINVCGATLAGTTTSLAPVSADGRVIFFASGLNSYLFTDPACTAENGGGQLYARIDGTTTVQISRSLLASPPAPAGAPKFLGATDDGRHVFFASPDQLTADDGAAAGGLYEYDLTKLLSGDASVGTLTFLAPAIPDTFGPVLLAASSDGSTAYFTSSSALKAEATAGEENIYRLGHGGIDYVGTLAGYFVHPNLFTASVDLSKLAYVDQASDGTDQIYLYDAHDPSAGVRCVSCPTGGAVAAGDSSFYGTIGNPRPAALGPNSFVANDGRVFFTSPDQLANGDANDHLDVYEFVHGARELLSSGTSSKDAMLIGVSADGRDAFFLTNDSLVARDFDNGDQDIYDARVDGGFPQPVAPVACRGASCHGPASTPPELPIAATVSFAGSGNAGSAPAHGAKMAAKVRAAKRAAVRGYYFRVRVRAPSAGRIRVNGRGVRTAKRAARRHATYSVRVVLTQKARRALRRRHVLHLRLRVMFRPRHGRASSAVVRVTVGRPRAKHEHRRRALRNGRAAAGRPGIAKGGR